MKSNGNAGLTSDRFQNANSAISNNGGYFSLPTGIYFTGDFTFTLWGNLLSTNTYSRILFLSSDSSNTYFITFNFGNSNTIPRFRTNDGDILLSSESISLNNWYHLAFTLNGTNAYIYVNGQITASGSLIIPSNIVLNYNYFGYSSDGYVADAKLDMIKFYGRYLSLPEIQTELTQIFNKI